jgi:hypothetical protein
MKKEAIDSILMFMLEKEGRMIPEKWLDFIFKDDLIQKLENHPEGVQYSVSDDLDLGITKITRLPDKLYVGGSFNLFHCKQLTKLPDDLYVERNLDLVGCDQLTELSDELYVGRDLDMERTNISELPKKYLFVGRRLIIKDTPLAKKYTDEEIRKIVASTGGEIRKQIIR